MSAHATRSPSAAESWMTCPDFPNAVAGLPNESSEFAAEGTAAHSISDDCLALGLDAYDFIGSKLTVTEQDEEHGIDNSWTFEWTEEDAEQLQYGIDEVRALGGEFFGEHRVDLSEIMGIENQFGTLDRGVISEDLIVINDLKWGRGIPVSPVRNKQLMIYGLGFWKNIARHRTDAKEFLFMIDQPRCPGGGGQWRCSLDEMLAFADEVKAAAIRTTMPNPPRIASEKGCFWCARRQQPPTEEGAVSGCKAYDDFNMDMLGSKLDEIVLEDQFVAPSPLSLERRSWIVRHKKVIETWLEHLHTATITDGLNGDPIPGFKVVDGRRGHKKWIDEKKAEIWLDLFLGNKVFTKKLISPAQAIKKLKVGDRRMIGDSDLSQQGQPKPILVDEEDARPAKATADDKLDVVKL